MWFCDSDLAYDSLVTKLSRRNYVGWVKYFYTQERELAKGGSFSDVS